MDGIICIDNIEKYLQEIINGKLILTPKKKYITENELNITNIRYSNIVDCLIKKEDKIITKTKKYYMFVLFNLWNYMPTQKILQTSTFNFKLTNENGKNGYRWSDKLKMSYQNKDAKGTLKEIINMVKVNKFTMDLSIKLETSRIIHFKIE
jgi:hypothetical protein